MDEITCCRYDGVPDEQLARVRAPIGLDLGGRSPEEIALAILAKVVQVRYGGSGRPRALLEQGNWLGVWQPFVSFPVGSRRGVERPRRRHGLGDL